MTNQISNAKLLLQIFETEWADASPEFNEKIKQYSVLIKRLFSIDNQLTQQLQNQMLLKSDQLSTSNPETREIHVKMKCEASHNRLQFSFKSYPIPWGTVFSSVEIRGLSKIILITPNQTNFDHIKENLEISHSRQITVLATFHEPMLQLSQSFRDLFSSSSASRSEISLKLFSYIDSKNLSQKGVVNSDKFLKALSEKDTFNLDSISQIIQSNTMPNSQFITEVEIPSFAKTFTMTVQPKKEIQLPNHLFEELPIQELLNTILESKNFLSASQEFKDDPNEFIVKMKNDFAQTAEIPEMYSSSYYFNNSWVLDTAADFLKIPEKKTLDLH